MIHLAMIIDKKEKFDDEMSEVSSILLSVLRSAMAGLFLAAYCGSSGSSLDPVRLVPSSSL